jgi:hypothetical protein
MDDHHWLNHFMDDLHLLNHFMDDHHWLNHLMDDLHFSYITKKTPKSGERTEGTKENRK